MPQKDVRRTFRKYRKRLDELCAGVAPRFDRDDIHDLRTTVKKFRALLRCLGKDGKKMRLPAAFKHLYHITGELRNAQLLLARVKAGKAPELSDWLTLRIVKLEKEWRESYTPGAVRGLGKKARYKKAGRKTLDSFLEKERAVLGSLLEHRPLPDEALHEVRKVLKDMRYAMEWFGETPKGRLLRIGEEAGEFMDSRTAILLLNACLRDTEGAVHPRTLVLKDTWEMKKARQKKKVIRALEQQSL